MVGKRATRRVVPALPGLVCGAGQYGFQAAGEVAAGEEDAAAALHTFQADVGSQADDAPFIAAARVWLAQAHTVPQLQVGQHGGHYNTGWYNPSKAHYMFLDMNLPTLIARVIVLLVAFTVHELAHAWTADRFGDLTPRMNGRLTLNPLAHLDPIGSLMLVFAGFGWAKPVPVNPTVLERHSSAAPMWVSLAGPASNLVMAVLFAIPFQLGLVSPSFNPSGQVLPSLGYLLFEFVYINLLLFLFNLIPIAPLDGEKILYYLAPPSLARVLDNIRPYGPILLLAVVFLGPVIGFNFLGLVLGPPLQALMSILIG